jgi:crotonobetainyl-CoA:carnitine CoA-transferase CaiB-like acyl-CoA transferase
MTKEKGRELARRLIATADIVTENFTTPVTQRFGLTYEQLKQVKLDIILLSQSSMGRTGPLGNTVGWGPTDQAYSGLPMLTGYEGGTPQSMGGTWPDYLIGVTGPFMMMAALHHRDRTGEGQFIDLSMCEVVTGMIPQAILDYQMNGRVRQPSGNKDPRMAPHDVYRCAGKDQWVAIAVETEEEWGAFCNAVGRPEWRADERFADAYARHRHEQELDALITQWTSERSPSEAAALLQAAGVAAGPVLDTMGIITNPQLRHRGFFVTPDHPEVGPREVMGIPVLFGAIPEKRIQPAPLFDEHNDYVFKELLGLSGTEIEQLIEERVIY